MDNVDDIDWKAKHDNMKGFLGCAVVIILILLWCIYLLTNATHQYVDPEEEDFAKEQAEYIG